MKIALILFNIFLSLNLSAAENVRKLVENGLNLLYKNAHCTEKKFCLDTEDNKNTLVDKALKFKNQVDQLIRTAQIKNLIIKKNTLNSVTFEFDSLIQKSKNDPANKVKGLIFYPLRYEQCTQKFPATILLNKLSDSFDDEIKIAEMAAMENKGIVMLMYLPYFGPRKNSSENAKTFITKNQTDFEINVLQSVLDIHLSYLLIKENPQVQKNNIGLMGLSLGAMMTLISAGLDPVFDRYATNVGGGDLANIVTYRKSGDIESNTGRALKDIDWSVDQARYELSKFDAITWSQNVVHKKILLINAKNDELINPENSLSPLIEGYRSVSTETNLIMHEGTHVFRVKEVGFLDTLTKVFFPMLNFIGTNSPNMTICNPGLGQ